MSIRRPASGSRGRTARTGALGAAVAAFSLFALATGGAGSANAADTGEYAAINVKQTVVRGGDPIYAPGRSCTLGFNATSGSTGYGIGAGHCLNGASTWYADPALTIPVGTTVGTSFPSNDYGLIQYTNPAVAHPGEIDTGSGSPVDITGAGNPTVGQSICHVGRVSGLHCGTVTGINLTVTYPEGVVTGLFRSNAPSESGDAGGPAYSGSTALGIISGQGGGSTFYQPITEVLAVYGLTLA